MWRFILIAFALAFAVPFLPGLIQPYLDAQKAEQVEERDAAEAARGSGRTFKIPLGPHGQYLTEGRLNGRTIEMLVDTGASKVAMPENVARKIGIFPKPADYTVPINTANGVTTGARATIRNMKLGSIRLRNIDAIIMKDEQLGVTLLGMSALNKLDRFDFSNDMLVLVQ